MCKNFHIPCICGIFVVSLRSQNVKIKNIYLIEKHAQLLEDYERNYFSGRKCNEVVPVEQSDQQTNHAGI